MRKWQPMLVMKETYLFALHLKPIYHWPESTPILSCFCGSESGENEDNIFYVK